MLPSLLVTTATFEGTLFPFMFGGRLAELAMFAVELATFPAVFSAHGFACSRRVSIGVSIKIATGNIIIIIARRPDARRIHVAIVIGNDGDV